MSAVAKPHIAPPATEPPPGLTVRVAGVEVQALAAGALWLAAERTLVVSDLHLEKGSAFAARGQLLPPYDTRQTLIRLSRLVDALRPDRVISLGDSFHDRRAEARLSEADAVRIGEMTARCDWVWIEGNHDPLPPERLGGRAASRLDLGGLSFVHEPSAGAAPGEVAGHLHPCAKVAGRGRSVRRKCFATDRRRMILPAFGAYTGGLNVRDRAFAPLFSDRNAFRALALGEARVYSLARSALLGDRA